MNSGDREFCLQAIAYIKAALPLEGEPALELGVLDSPVVKKVGPILAATYVVDTGDAFAYVQQRHLKAAGLTPDQLHKKAIYNLAVIAEAKVRVQPYGNIYTVLMGGNFEASLLLFDGFWSQSCAHLAPNGFVAALPARDVLAFTDAGNACGIQELRELCARIGEPRDHPLTSQLHVYAAGSWQPYG